MNWHRAPAPASPRLPDDFEDVRWTRADALFLLATLLGTLLLLTLLPSDAYLYRADTLYFHAVEHAVRAALRAGEWPLWNVYFSEPLLANPQAMVLYPTHALLRFLPIRTVLVIDVFVHVWLMLAALYVLLRDWSLSRIASAGAALAVGPSSLIVARVVNGHIAQLPAYPWAILAVLFHRRLLQRGRPADFLLTVLATVMIVLGGHSQQSLTALLIPGCFLLYFLLAHWNRPDVLRAVALSAAVGIVSAALLAVQLLPTFEYLLQTSRIDGFSLEEASVYALDPALLLNLFTPFLPHEVMHFPSGFQEQTFYTGLMSFGLVLIAWRNAPARHRALARYLTVVGALALLLALGENGPLFSHLFALLPFLRAPGRFLQIWTFCGALLVGIGIEALLTQAAMRRRMLATLWLCLALAAGVVIALAVADVYVFTDEPLETDLRPVLLVSVALLAVWLATLLLQRTRLGHGAWLRVFVGALALDAVVTAVFLAFWPLYREIYPSYEPLVAENGRHACLARQLDPRETRLVQVSRRRFAEAEIRAAAALGIPVLADYAANLVYTDDLVKLGLRGTNLLAASYQLSRLPPESDDWVRLRRTCGLTLWAGKGVLPRVRAVGQLEVVPDGREASLSAVRSAGFDAGRSAVVSRSDSMPELPALPSAPLRYEARITHYSANEIRASVDVSQAALVVIAEPFHPGWTARVDGAPAHVWRVDHALRGVTVAAGRHEVVLRYEPRTFEIGAGISLAALASLLAGSVLAGLRRGGAGGLG